VPDMTAVWPTDQSPGNVSSEARWRKMARMWATSGVDDSPLAVAGRLAPTLAAGPIINVAAGACWVDGHYCELNPGTAIPATANGVLVVRFTPADGRSQLVYVDAATLPPTQTAATWELAIASMAAGALTDRRMFLRAGAPPCFPNFATLKALYPATAPPPDGYQATTLDDGRTYTFRSAAFTYTPPGAAAPANRWECTFYATVTKTTGATDGITTIGVADCNVDGFIHVGGHGGWDAAAPPNLNHASHARWVNAGALQMRAWNVSATSAGSLAVRLNSSLNFTVWGLGWRNG